MEKSEFAFRTISEVADLLDLPQHVLRFWETKFRQVSPMKRGGGRRYYRPHDVELLRRIKCLLHTEGYTIKGVQRMLGQGGAKNLPPVNVPGVAFLPSSSPQTKSSSPQTESLDTLSPPSAAPLPSLGLADELDLGAIVGELEKIRDLLKKSSTP